MVCVLRLPRADQKARSYLRISSSFPRKRKNLLGTHIWPNAFLTELFQCHVHPGLDVSIDVKPFELIEIEGIKPRHIVGQDSTSSRNSIACCWIRGVNDPDGLRIVGELQDIRNQDFLTFANCLFRKPRPSTTCSIEVRKIATGQIFLHTS